MAVYAANGGVLIPPDVNTIGALEPSAAYRIFCTAPETLRVSGLPQSTNLEFPLVPEIWNWIGYPLGTPQPVTASLAGIADHVRIVQNDNGAAWIPAENINTLGSLVPGKGYMIMVDAPCTLHFAPGAGSAAQHGAGSMSEAPRPDDAPRATGIPYAVVVRMTDALRAQQPHTITLLDGAECVGKSFVDASGLATLVPAWQGLPDLALEGYSAGHPLTIEVATADGKRLPVNVRGDAGRYGEGAYQTILLESAPPAPLPGEFQVGAAYPNPFNPTVSIPFDLPNGGRVEIVLHNTLGQVVFQHSAVYTAGAHVFTFSTADARPGLVSGVYFAQARYNGHSTLQKLVLLK